MRLGGRCNSVKSRFRLIFKSLIVCRVCCSYRNGSGEEIVFATTCAVVRMRNRKVLDQHPISR